MNWNHKYVLSGANVLWILIIFILCAMPSEDIPDPHLDIPHLDKVVHFGMFFIMSLLLCYPLELHSSLSRKKIYTIAILVSFVYGGLIEILQHNFFNRGGDVWDLTADVAGGVAGCIFYPLFLQLLDNVTKRSSDR